MSLHSSILLLAILTAGLAASSSAHPATGSSKSETGFHLVFGRISGSKLTNRGGVESDDEGILISDAGWNAKLRLISTLDGSKFANESSIRISCHCGPDKNWNGRKIVLLGPSGQPNRYFAERIFDVSDDRNACIPDGAAEFRNVRITARHRVERRLDGDQVCFDLTNLNKSRV